MQGAQVRSLVEELRYHMPRTMPSPILVHNKVFSVNLHFLSETKQTKNIPEDEK